MSPRGVAIPEVRQQLFDAAERVLLREGPSGLSGRAITREAGVATGLLYNHFPDLDEFLAELLLDRARKVTASLSGLPGRAGTSTVVDNLMSAVETLFSGNVLALAGLALARPAIVAGLGRAVGDGTLTMDAGERLFAAYLEAERTQGRISEGADTASLALALVGAAHQLLLTRGPHAPDLRERMHQVTVTLIAGVSRP
ncbi:TetR/AcrR family transcriptional regulator [Nonomuraea sp. NPDC005983]|uniref:TetR/AcrR family transcriptional regulator n=1 Tax=Nonomuraea sp. NPDC005983 TaxID=3155595 RepID=UPI0033A7CDEC